MHRASTTAAGGWSSPPRWPPAARVRAACGGAVPRAEASTPGVTDNTVKVGAHFPLTGVAAPGYSEIPTGAKAYFDYVNAAGGVNGRKIEYVVRTTATTPPTPARSPTSWS